MGNFFEDLANTIVDSTLTEEEQVDIRARFFKLKREVITDFRRVFPHGQILPENSGRGIRIRLPPDPTDNSQDTADQLPTQGIPDVMTTFDGFVNNELPTYLLHVPDRRLVSRNEVKKIFRRELSMTTEEDIAVFLKGVGGRSVPTREEAIRALVKGKVQYATLSHRWLDKGEPTFHDIKMSFRPAGYDKLIHFCEKAAEYGCRLAWSDTCCINKDSSTELEEAIRSMFKWYRDCHVCIAYLAESTSADDLSRDVWFSRGWTLQELLAPRTMKFYGRGWAPLSNSTNDKQDTAMMSAISQTTRIPLDDLRHFRPGTRDIHARMMWASTRTTTRIEDVAYSLIGVFDVSMTIAYGEGKRAFYRLMEAIIHRCGEWQIMAWAGKHSADSTALPDSPRCFKDLGTLCATPSDESQPDRAWRGDRHFVMTKRGLQLRVLMVNLPLPFAKLYEGVGPDRKDAGGHGQCTVGVVDYWCYDTSGQGTLKPMQDHLCLLLHSDPFDPFAEWQKVVTPDLLFVRVDEEVQETLATVWL